MNQNELKHILTLLIGLKTIVFCLVIVFPSFGPKLNHKDCT